MDYKIYNADCLDKLKDFEENSIDCIITDPPYGLTSITKRFGKKGSAPAKYGKDGSFSRLSRGFMGKEWDGSGIEYNVDMWGKCLRVLKPGGYLLAFGGTRTHHRIACAIEDAGFEIRDTIMWLYGSGFPKSMDIGKAVDKKNGVKPIGRKEPTGGITGGKNTGAVDKGWHSINNWYEYPECQNEWKGWGSALKPSFEPIAVARKPFNGSLVNNVIEHGVGGLNIDECRDNTGRFPANTILDTHDGEEWRRYFYCAKASKKDRDEGLEEFEEKTSGQMTERKENSAGITAYAGSRSPKRNSHPTVKPTALMQYLVRLVAPKGATILDPFMGSGSTGKAVMYENKERGASYKFIGIEKEPEYCKIAEARIEYAKGGE